MNSVNITGRLGRDIDLRYTQDERAIARFTVAVDRVSKGKKDTDWINVTAFGSQAENANKYLRKGSKVGVSGNIKTGSYEKQDGTKVYTFEVWAERIEFLDSKSDRDPAEERPAENYRNESQQGFQPVDDIPF